MFHVFLLFLQICNELIVIIFLENYFFKSEFLCSTHGPTWQKHCPNWQKKKKKKKKIDPDVAMLPTSKWFAVAPENH